jgi:apolipoprotein N-acyltransferase
LQLASLFGVGGIAFLLGLVEAALAMLLDSADRRLALRHLSLVGVLLLAAHVWGSVRAGALSGGPTVTAAAVVTDLGMGRSGLPEREELRKNEDLLFDRTALAARRGARLVAWNEAATLVETEDEPRLLERGKASARALGIDLVLAYGVVLSRSPLSLGNRYAWLGPEGAILETYEKHHPVPGEPSLRGTAPLAALDRPWGRAAGAICYDYDFPAMARAHARLGAGVVVVPSSDWLGIDPTHTLVTRVRAIEGGFSVLRPVRWSTSAAFDAYGRTRSSLSPWEENDRVMLAVLPVAAVPTLYARLGDTPLLAVCGMVLAACLLLSAWGGRRRGA